MALKRNRNTDVLPETAEETAEKPYKVFNTKEEYDAEIASLLEGAGGGSDAAEAAPREERGGGYGAAPIISDGIVEEWQRDAEKLATVVPDFDFRSALGNSAFKSALTSGKNVFEAYAEMTRVPDYSGRSAISQNAQTARRGTGEASANPAKLSSEDFKRYIENRRNM